MAVNINASPAIATASSPAVRIRADLESLDFKAYLGEYHNKVLDDAPIAYWRLNEYNVQDGDAADSSGNGYDAARMNVVQAGESIGDLHPMAYFDGDYDYVDLTDSGVLGDVSISAGSIMLWFKLDSAIVGDSQAHTLLTIRTDDNNRITVERTSSNSIQATYQAAGTARSVDSASFDDTNLHCLIFTWDVSGDEIELFIDGTSVGTESLLGTWSGALAEAYLGYWTTYFQGHLAHLAVFDSILDSTQIAAAIFPAGRDISDYANNAALTAGKVDWKSTISPVGSCSIELDNTDQRFTPENESGPYYGELVPNIPIRIDATDGRSTWTRFRGLATVLNPDADQYGLGLATYTFEDHLGILQASDIVLPLQQNITNEDLLKLITSQVWQSGLAEVDAYIGYPADNDQVVLAGTTYTMRSSAAAQTNEIYFYAISTWGVSGSSRTGANDAAHNLAAAINNANGSGTLYETGILKHAQITAQGWMGVQSPETPANSQSLRHTTSNYSSLATSIRWKMPSSYIMKTEPNSVYIHFVSLLLRKVGSPTGTLTIRLETPDANGKPSGNLIYPGAEVTYSEAGLSTSFAEVIVEFPVHELSAEIEATDGSTSRHHWLVITTDRGVSGTDFVQWQYESYGTDAYERYAACLETGGTWGAVFNKTTFGFNLHARLRVQANARGAWGNALAFSGALLVTDDHYAGMFEGGSNGPAGYIDYSDDTRTNVYAADQWATDVNALSASEEISDSEFGYIFCTAEGVITLYDRKQFFSVDTVNPAIVVNNKHNIQVSPMDVQSIINRMSVTYVTRELSGLQAVARANTDIRVPGRVSSAGLDPTVLSNHLNPNLPGSGQKRVTLPFVSPETGKRVGATELVLPLVANTDFTVVADDGYDYTDDDVYGVSAAVTSSGVELLLTNFASGDLNFRSLQVRGKTLEPAESLEIVRNDSDSQLAYRVRDDRFKYPMSTDDPEGVASDTAYHILSLFAEPQTIIKEVGFKGELVVEGLNVWSLNIGDVIRVIETQTNQDRTVWIVGRTERLTPNAIPEIKFFVVRLDRLTYWILGKSGRSEVGNTTVMGL